MSIHAWIEERKALKLATPKKQNIDLLCFYPLKVTISCKRPLRLDILGAGLSEVQSHYCLLPLQNILNQSHLCHELKVSTD